MTSDKYLISLAIPQPQRAELEKFMNKVARVTDVPPPYRKMEPHVTFHRPIVGISERKILDLAHSMSLQVPTTRLVAGPLYNFGSKFIVSPIHATRRLVKLWLGITDLLAVLPEYEHGEFDDDNTLHITIAEDLTPVFDTVWPIIRKYKFDPLTIPITTLTVGVKLAGEHSWQKVEEFPLRS